MHSHTRVFRSIAPRAAAMAFGMMLVAAAAAAASAAASAAGAAVHPSMWPKVHAQPLVDAATEVRIGELLARMSVPEKVGQVIQADIISVTPQDLAEYPLGSVLAGGNGGPGGDDRAPAAAWLAMAQGFHRAALEPRAGHVAIPLLFGIDAVHGHNNIVGAPLFPHNIGIGAAHEPALAARIGAATAAEVAATGIDWVFAPTVAVPQDVRWGRSYEGWSQDPAQVRDYARAAVTGIQGDAGLAGGRLQAGHVAASAKHYIGDGGTHNGVDQGDNLADERMLIARHAQGYVGAIEAGALTVMASYSSWHGTKMHGNHALLTDVLKDRMGFQGFVIGDYDAHSQLPGCTSSNCAAAFNAGVDMFMAPNGWRELYHNLVSQVQDGTITMARLDDAVRRILRVKFALGMFDAARPYEGRLELLADPTHRALAREAVAKSLVLLKNDGALPLRAGARVVVTGPGADSLPMQCGGWSITWQSDDTTNADYPGAQTVREAIVDAMRAAGGKVSEDVPLGGADRPDAAIIVFGERPYAEMHGDVQFALYNVGNPLRLLAKYREAGIPTISVFLSGRPLWVRPEIEASSAFVAAWLPGTEAGGIADVLVGDAAGKPRHDFQGTLSFAWPDGPLPPPAAAPRGQTWEPGYGLRYAQGAFARGKPKQ